jgi:hypothetical protein
MGYQKIEGHIRIGACALLWAVCTIHNALYFIKEASHILCRLSHWSRIGSICGPFCSRWRNVGTCILGAIVWPWSHGISTASAVGCLRRDSHRDAPPFFDSN